MTAGSIHTATAVAIGGRAILFEGPPGSGKSTLALKLIDRGAILIGDDAVTTEMRSGTVWACPPPNISGKLEIRNVGIIDLPVTSAPVCLVLRLTGDAPRFVESAGNCSIADRSFPCLAFDPKIAAASLRAEWALRRYGLSS